MQRNVDKTDCGFVRHNLFPYREKCLSPGEREKFEAHCRSCETCSRLVADFRSFEVLVEEKKAAVPDPYIHTRTLLKIDDYFDGRKKKPVAFSRMALKPLLAAFVILFALTIGFMIGRQADTKFSATAGSAGQSNIGTIRSDLFIADFTDEKLALLDNQ